MFQLSWRLYSRCSAPDRNVAKSVFVLVHGVLLRLSSLYIHVRSARLERRDSPRLQTQIIIGLYAHSSTSNSFRISLGFDCSNIRSSSCRDSVYQIKS